MADRPLCSLDIAFRSQSSKGIDMNMTNLRRGALSLAHVLAFTAAFWMVGAVASTIPEVGIVKEAPKIDGRLDEKCWTVAEWNGGFSRLANSVKDRSVGAQTRFAFLADDRTLYVAVKCDEPNMDSLKATPPRAIYTCDEVELFLCPRGDGFEFYQFVVAFDPRNGEGVRYFSEGGIISPDPYGPSWKFARGELKDGWCVEIAIPFSSFYMTRNAEWRDNWKVNVARMRWTGGLVNSTWSQLERGFLEPNNFRKIKGFPKRMEADDVGITDVVAEMSGRQGGKLVGTLSFTATVAQRGEYEVSSPFAATTSISLKKGDNIVRVPCVYPSNGRHKTRIELKRKATGETYARIYPVVVDFDEIRLSLTSPEYRDNFYPGQDASCVRGRVQCALAGEVVVTLEGPGFPVRKAHLPNGGGAIDFDTHGFKDGTAVLSVAVGDVTREFRIRKLAKTGKRMAWISKGRLIVDGKPVLRRNLYASGYMGGKAFAEKFAADKRLYLTPEVVSGGSLEPNRVIKGLESREARKDIRPCKEYFDKVDAMIEASRDRDFVYWYISDEPECRGVSPVYLRHIYEYMKEKDPYHVILTASRGGRKYVDCADWFETHPYLNPHDDGRGNRVLEVPPNKIGSYLDAFGVWDRPDKCVGFLPTLFTYRFASILNDYPTFPEYVCHVWAAMLRGGKTLWPFAYYDMGSRAALYEGNRYVNSTFAVLEDFILDGKRTTLLKTSDAECVRWDLDCGAAMFALANFTSERKRIPLPNGLSDRKWHPFRGQWAEGRALEPYEVVVGVTEERGSELETYAEALALVKKLEYERTHRDNQILEKYMALGFAASNGNTRFFRLVDGVRDVLGWSAKAKEPWVEFSFLERPLQFSRVRVYGSGLENMKVMIRQGGEWKELSPKSSTAEKYMRELYFGDVHSTVKMRLSFPAERGNSDVELYEVEIPAVDGMSGSALPCAENGRLACPNAAASAPADVLWSLYDGGFMVRQDVAHTVKIDPEYPWLEVEVDSFVGQKERAYSAWRLWFLKYGFLAGGVTYPQTGRYIVRMPKVEKSVNAVLRLDDHNFDIDLKRLRCVKNPADFITVETAGGADVIRPGETIDVTLTLAQPCADVSAAFLIDYGKGRGFVGFHVNGTNAIELKATKDGAGRIWKASIPVKRCDKADARRVYIKCIVLGGALNVPIFTTVDSPFQDIPLRPVQDKRGLATVHLEDAASKPAAKTSSLPGILLIGDSIRIGYCGAVSNALAGKAEVKWPKPNCQNSQNILISLAGWRGLVASPKVVQFNCGHWDAAHWDGDDSALTTVEEYGRNVRKIICRIRRYWPEAKIVFATTTPMNPSGELGRNVRTTEAIRLYNAEGVKVAKSEGVEVNDLFAATEKWPASDYADYCHFKKAAAKRLGEIVASRLAKVAGL